VLPQPYLEEKKKKKKKKKKMQLIVSIKFKNKQEQNIDKIQLVVFSYILKHNLWLNPETHITDT